jgi:hypothetical protein
MESIPPHFQYVNELAKKNMAYDQNRQEYEYNMIMK